MQALAALAAEMRALGVRSLAIELDSPVLPTYEAPEPTELVELAPPRPEKPSTHCIVEGCHQAKEGVFGAALDYCAVHALREAGVR